jgi:hypothetical protein
MCSQFRAKIKRRHGKKMYNEGGNAAFKKQKDNQFHVHMLAPGALRG